MIIKNVLIMYNRFSDLILGRNADFLISEISRNSEYESSIERHKASCLIRHLGKPKRLSKRPVHVLQGHSASAATDVYPMCRHCKHGWTVASADYNHRRHNLILRIVFQ